MLAAASAPVRGLLRYMFHLLFGVGFLSSLRVRFASGSEYFPYDFSCLFFSFLSLFPEFSSLLLLLSCVWSYLVSGMLARHRIFQYPCICRGCARKKTHLSFEIEDFVETQLCQLRVVLAILAILPSRMLQLVHDLVKGTVRWLCLVSNMAITELVFR